MCRRNGDIACNKQFAGIGVIVNSDGGNIKIARVQEGDPAEKAGIKVGDIITQIDRQTIGGVELEKVVGMLRGAVDTEVKLLISRNGQPIEASVRRKMIHFSPTQELDKK